MYTLFISLLLLVDWAHSVTIRDNKCEVNTANGVTYKACLGTTTYPRLIGNKTVTISPANITCGDPPSSYIDFKTNLNKMCTGSEHSPEKLYDFKRNNRPDPTWWQSRLCSDSGQLETVITLPFGKLFMLTSDITIDFVSGRPRDVLIDKSLDGGKTWEPFQAFSRDCTNYTANGYVYGNIGDIKSRPYAVVCDERYSGPTSGEMKMELLERYKTAYSINPYSDLELLYQTFNTSEWNRFHLLSSLRITLKNPNGCSPTSGIIDRFKSFFAIQHVDISVRCWCNLHGRSCRNDGGNYRCICFHNTEGTDCERCKPLYNERPWAPGRYDTQAANECIKCNCNEHADSCTYVEQLGGGRCNNCYHNTEGVHCQTCVLGFYRNESLPLDHPDVCTACDCQSEGVANGDLTCQRNATVLKPIGQCYCKDKVKGRACDVCIDEYFGLLLNASPGTCKACACNLDGTGGDNICEPQQGQCPCKLTIEGRTCNQCRDTFFDFPTGRQSEKCKECECIFGARRSPVCDKVSGNCPCRPNITGRRCNDTLDNYYYPYVDSLLLQPVSGSCVLTSHTARIDFTGQNFMSCSANQTVVFEPLTGAQQQTGVNTTFKASIRFSNTNGPWSNGVLTATVQGDSGVDVARFETGSDTIDPKCPLVGDVQTFDLGFIPGTSKAWTSSDINIDIRCRYSWSLMVGFAESEDKDLDIDSLLLLPVIDRFESFTLSEAGVKKDYSRCMDQFAALGTRDDYTKLNECKDLTFGLSTELYNGALECDCDVTGTYANTTCQKYGGQCQCKPGVFGRRCDLCQPGFFKLTDSGCTACDCDGTGSTSLVCDFNTGQCPCKLHVATASDLTDQQTTGDRQCRSCKADHYSFSSGNGCRRCGCNADGQLTSQCDAVTGVCKCKATIGGEKCDRCSPTHFNFSSNGCMECGCMEAGSMSLDCDQITGTCSCKTNVKGEKCNQCKDMTFNMAAGNPDGCQPCFCFGHGQSCSSAQGYVQDVTNVQPSDSHFTAAQTRYKLSEFAGNRLSSYGQLLTVRMKYEFTYSLDNKPILFLNSPDMDVFYKQSSLELVDGVLTNVSAALYESNWFINDTHQPSAFEFYDVLNHLTSVTVVRKYESVFLDILGVSMVTASLATDGETTFIGGVETCSCTASSNTQGLSCDQCDTGYQRSSQLSSKYDGCIACNCSGRSQSGIPECNPITGECLNCRVGTIGANCSECAPNVVGDNCDICEQNYTRLGQNGCVACGCDPIGSKNATCDQLTSQCHCNDRVTGQRCDRCEDNYSNMTAGCYACDTCYNLVGDEVNKLRKLRDNLTSLVTEIEAWEDNSRLGSFMTRLSSTMNGMTQLLNFLSSAQSLGGQVQTEIQVLNSSLQYFNMWLTKTEADILQANASFSAASNDLKAAEASIAQTTNLVIDGYNKLKSDLVELQKRLSPLTVGVQQIEVQLVDHVSTVDTKVAVATTEVEMIEQKAVHIGNMSEEALQIATDSEALHKNVTQRMSQLGELLQSIITLEAQLITKTAEGAVNVSAVRNDVTAIVNKVNNIGEVTYKTADLIQEAQGLKTRADEINSQANQGVLNNQSTVEKVNEAQQITQQLTNSVQGLVNQSETLLQVAKNAHDEAKTANDLEEETFKKALSMLTTLQQFDVKSQEVESSANSSLKQVISVKSASEALIVQAQTLRSSLKVTLASAQLAYQRAAQAEQIARSISQELLSVSVMADSLEKQTSSVLNGLSDVSTNIVSTNTSLLQPTCQSIQTQENTVSIMVEQSKLARERAENASRDVNQTRDDIGILKQRLQIAGSLDSAAISKLVDDVKQAQNESTQEDMRTIVAQLVANVKEQKAWIDEMKNKKTELSTQIQQLNLLSSSLP